MNGKITHLLVAGLCASLLATRGTHAAVAEFAINLDGVQAGTGSPATGIGAATLDTNTNTLQWNIAFDASAFVAGPASVTTAHFHPGAPGISGPALNPPGNVAGTGKSPLVGAAVISNADKAKLLAGAVYFNVHSTAFPAGEIRGQVLPQKISLAAAKDNTLYETPTGSASNGQGEHLFAGRGRDGERKRAVIMFDVAAAGIPAGSTITGVELTLNMSKSSAGPANVTVHRIAQNWGEGSSDAPAEEGDGTQAARDDATWLHTFFNTSLWANPGGDFAPVPSASRSVAGPAKYTWGPTDAVTADVQAWLNNPADNFGWLLLGNELIAQTAKRFDSSENPVPANQPTLTIRYTSPCLFKIAGDLNDDCKVNFLDFAAVANNWLAECGSLPLDPACVPK